MDLLCLQRYTSSFLSLTLINFAKGHEGYQKLCKLENVELILNTNESVINYRHRLTFNRLKRGSVFLDFACEPPLRQASNGNGGRFAGPMHALKRKYIAL